MSNAIPLSKDFSITTGVVSAAGTGMTANCLMLTTSTTQQPITVQYATELSDVQSLYGASSDEATCAAVYFNGFDNASILPGQLLIAGIPSAATSGALTGGSMSGVTMATINALAVGTIVISVDGTQQESTAIDLTSAASQSAVATILQSALTGVTVAWNSTTNRFVITSSTTGASSSVSPASTGAIATALMLTSATGATATAGSGTLTLTELMDNIVDQTQNWFCLAVAQDLTNAQKLELATWINNQGKKFAYALNDATADAKVNSSTTAFYPNSIVSAGLQGSMGIYGTPEYAFTAPSYFACIDFDATNGRITAKFRQYSGLTPNVTKLSDATALESNGYSYYGKYAENTVLESYFGPGNISGDFLWMDSYINQRWIKSILTTSLATLFLNNQSYAFNGAGEASVRSAILDPMNSAVNFGAAQKGVDLSNAQLTIIKNAVGADVKDQLYSNGWYFYIPTQSSATRVKRDLAGCVLYYVDGQMIQSIDMQSNDVL